MAGSDTTGIALTHLFYLIVDDRRVYEKFVKEVRTAFAAGSLSSPVRYTDAVKLEYWIAYVKEAEHYSPSVGLGQPRIIPSGGVTLAGGQYLPGDYQTVTNPNVAHFDKNCFGGDAERFGPESWI
jgi:cytochrome P450